MSGTWRSALLAALVGVGACAPPPPEEELPEPDRCDGVDTSLGIRPEPEGSSQVDLDEPPSAYGALVPFPPQNPYTYEKALLGKILFWEEQLSSDDTMACGTCHRPAAGGSDPRAGSAGSRHPGPDGDLDTADDPHGGRGIARCTIDESGAVVRTSDAVFGDDPQVTRRKPPTYLDAMYFASLFWDGRATGEFIDPDTEDVAIPLGGALESQAVGPPLNDGEMACEDRTWADVHAKLAAAKPLAKARDLPDYLLRAVCEYDSYPKLFELAFGTDEITTARIAFAIATHERTLVSDETPFDRFQAGDLNALTAAQQNGLVAFNDGTQGACLRCHGGAQFSNGGFMNIGFVSPEWDHGRYDVIPGTGVLDPTTYGAFKVPNLRNVGLREAGGLLHDGVGLGVDLESVLDAYVAPPFPPGVDSPTDPRMTPLNLSDIAIDDIIDFLRHGLTDPRVANEEYPFDRPTLGSEP